MDHLIKINTEILRKNLQEVTPMGGGKQRQVRPLPQLRIGVSVFGIQLNYRCLPVIAFVSSVNNRIRVTVVIVVWLASAVRYCKSFGMG